MHGARHVHQAGAEPGSASRHRGRKLPCGRTPPRGAGGCGPVGSGCGLASAGTETSVAGQGSPPRPGDMLAQPSEIGPPQSRRDDPAGHAQAGRNGSSRRSARPGSAGGRGPEYPFRAGRPRRPASRARLRPEPALKIDQVGLPCTQSRVPSVGATSLSRTCQVCRTPPSSTTSTARDQAGSRPGIEPNSTPGAGGISSASVTRRFRRTRC